MEPHNENCLVGGLFYILGHPKQNPRSMYANPRSTYALIKSSACVCPEQNDYFLQLRICIRIQYEFLYILL